MNNIKWTDSKIKIEPHSDKKKSLFIDTNLSLILHPLPSTVKSFRFRYYIDGKRKDVILGNFSDEYGIKQAKLDALNFKPIDNKTPLEVKKEQKKEIEAVNLHSTC